MTPESVIVIGQQALVVTAGDGADSGELAERIEALRREALESAGRP